MHLDHQKLVELLVEASGIEKEKVEKQLTELVAEIKQAIEEGEAYEVDNFGIFSGIGNNIIFIPSTELATEINYKYVGMEPIELVEDSTSPEAKAEGETENAKEEDDIFEEEVEEDDPFAGLLDDDEPEKEVEQEESLLQSLLNEEDEEVADSDDAEDLEEPPFNLDSASEEAEKIDEEEQDLPEELTAEETADEKGPLSELDDEELPKEQPGPDKWGIDTYKDDTAENMFSGMLGNDDSNEENEEQIHHDDILNKEEKESTEEDELSIKLDLDSGSEKEEENKDVGDFDENDEDFDDPFKGLVDQDEEDELEEEEDADVVPVITNISSGTAEKKPKEKKLETRKKRTPSKKRESSPAVLYVLISIIIICGGVFALGYFGIVDIPGIPVQTASTQMPAPSQPTSEELDNESNEQAIAEEQTQEQSQEEDAVDEDQNITDEPEEEAVPTEEEQSGEDLVTGTEDNISDPDQPLYGLKGTALSEANNGYTIVVYSLTKENNATNARETLAEDGFRALVASQTSSQYGRIWRVSIGQFESLRDAALAAETLERPYSENYFITKIQ